MFWNVKKCLFLLLQILAVLGAEEEENATSSLGVLDLDHSTHSTPSPTTDTSVDEGQDKPDTENALLRKTSRPAKELELDPLKTFFPALPTDTSLTSKHPSKAEPRTRIFPTGALDAATGPLATTRPFSSDLSDPLAQHQEEILFRRSFSLVYGSFLLRPLYYKDPPSQNQLNLPLNNYLDQTSAFLPQYYYLDQFHPLFTLTQAIFDPLASVDPYSPKTSMGLGPQDKYDYIPKPDQGYSEAHLYPYGQPSPLDYRHLLPHLDPLHQSSHASSQYHPLHHLQHN